MCNSFSFDINDHRYDVKVEILFLGLKFVHRSKGGVIGSSIVIFWLDTFRSSPVHESIKILDCNVIDLNSVLKLNMKKYLKMEHDWLVHFIQHEACKNYWCVFIKQVGDIAVSEDWYTSSVEVTQYFSFNYIYLNRRNNNVWERFRVR